MFEKIKQFCKDMRDIYKKEKEMRLSYMNERDAFVEAYGIKRH